MDDRALLLIKEASRIAIQINNDRLCGIVPESDLTVRLTEICDLLNDYELMSYNMQDIKRYVN